MGSKPQKQSVLGLNQLLLLCLHCHSVLHLREVWSLEKLHSFTCLLIKCFFFLNIFQDRSSAVDRSRFDSSLGLLTKRFLGLLQSAENGILDLNLASVTLAVQKRRIYDITNVLEGIGLLKKISKNNIQWKGSDSPADSAESQRGLNQDLADLEAKENQLDELISSTGTVVKLYAFHRLFDSFILLIESQLRSLSEEKRYAYVTYGDLKSIAEYRDNTVMAVRAPPETKLQVLNQII